MTREHSKNCKKRTQLFRLLRGYALSDNAKTGARAYHKLNLGFTEFRGEEAILACTMTKLKTRRILLAAVLLCFGCISEGENGPSAVVLYEKEIDGFASGSGMARLGSRFYAAGDDDPFLWILSAGGRAEGKMVLWDSATVKNGRIPKPIKPDFEAVTLFPYRGDTVILVFGSGSRSPGRDIIMLADLQGNVERTEADTAFFRKMRAEVSPDLNLEGAAHRSGELILLNRADNRMIRIPERAFSAFLNSGNPDTLTFQVHRYALPPIAGDSATFSGASVMSDGHTLLFSASVEVTQDAVEDGEISGSFIGILDLDRPEQPPAVARVFKEDGRPYLGKIEAAEGIFLDDGSIAVTAITDNDDGSTKFLQVNFRP